MSPDAIDKLAYETGKSQDDVVEMIRRYRREKRKARKSQARRYR